VQGDDRALPSIKLEDFTFGYDRPAIADLKLGSGWLGCHPGDPAFMARVACASKDLAEREALVARWLAMKKQMKRELSLEELLREAVGVPLRLGLTSGGGEPLCRADAFALIKSWRQEQVSKSTTQWTMGLSVGGMLFADELGGMQVSRSEGKDLTDGELVDLLLRFLRDNGDLAIALLDKLVKLKEWFAHQWCYRFYATSIVMVYDQLQPSRCDLRWLDFAHAIRLTSRGSPLSQQSSSARLSHSPSLTSTPSAAALSVTAASSTAARDSPVSPQSPSIMAPSDHTHTHPLSPSSVDQHASMLRGMDNLMDVLRSVAWGRQLVLADLQLVPKPGRATEAAHETEAAGSPPPCSRSDEACQGEEDCGSPLMLPQIDEAIDALVQMDSPAIAISRRGDESPLPLPLASNERLNDPSQPVTISSLPPPGALPPPSSSSAEGEIDSEGGPVAPAPSIVDRYRVTYAHVQRGLPAAYTFPAPVSRTAGSAQQRKGSTGNGAGPPFRRKKVLVGMAREDAGAGGGSSHSDDDDSSSVSSPMCLSVTQGAVRTNQPTNRDGFRLSDTVRVC